MQTVVWQETAGGASAAHDVCISAPTGSGKTLSYALPILQALSRQAQCPRCAAAARMCCATCCAHRAPAALTLAPAPWPQRPAAPVSPVAWLAPAARPQARRARAARAGRAAHEGPGHAGVPGLRLAVPRAGPHSVCCVRQGALVCALCVPAAGACMPQALGVILLQRCKPGASGWALPHPPSLSFTAHLYHPASCSLCLQPLHLMMPFQSPKPARFKPLQHHMPPLSPQPPSQASLAAEAELLASGMVDILVATPGRLISHLEGTPGFDPGHLSFLVIDETDRLLRQAYQVRLGWGGVGGGGSGGGGRMSLLVIGRGGWLGRGVKGKAVWGRVLVGSVLGLRGRAKREGTGW